MNRERGARMATKRRLHVTKANAQNGARKEFWPQFRKTALIRARYIPGAFTVETREGVLDMPEGGFLALDEDGYPYPIAADVFERTYEQVTPNRPPTHIAGVPFDGLAKRPVPLPEEDG
jgi:hypothetical protein